MEATLERKSPLNCGISSMIKVNDIQTMMIYGIMELELAR